MDISDLLLLPANGHSASPSYISNSWHTAWSTCQTCVITCQTKAVFQVPLTCSVMGRQEDPFAGQTMLLFVNSSAADIVFVTLSSTAVETAIAQCTSRWAMARGHRLNTSIVLAAVHGLSGLFLAVSAVEPFTLSSPSHSVPVPNKPSPFRGRKATMKNSRDFLRRRYLNDLKHVT